MRTSRILTCDLEDPFHPTLAVAALDAGLHVLCEKPLAARDRSGAVVQVGCMKRYDPAYRRALDLLPRRIEDVRLITVEVNDPDHEPFVAHLPMTWSIISPRVCAISSSVRAWSGKLNFSPGSGARPFGAKASR